MELQYIKVDGKKRTELHQCPYNRECRCRTKNCHKCGWNPTVAKARMEKVQTREVKSHG